MGVVSIVENLALEADRLELGDVLHWVVDAHCKTLEGRALIMVVGYLNKLAVCRLVAWVKHQAKPKSWV